MTAIPFDEAADKRLEDGDLIYRYQTTMIFGAAHEESMDDQPGWTRVVVQGEDLVTTVVAVILPGHQFCARWYPGEHSAEYVGAQGFLLQSERTARQLFPCLESCTFKNDL
jgi:hypothetical protein